MGIVINFFYIFYFFLGVWWGSSIANLRWVLSEKENTEIEYMDGIYKVTQINRQNSEEAEDAEC